MKVHLVDGTYELFRAFFAPANKGARSPDGREVGATHQLMRSMTALLREPDVSHVAASFDTVIESFRNDLYDGYKTGDGIEPDLKDQFPLAERATQALGMVTWGLVEFEADDGIATAAARCAADEKVDQVVICSPDKDLCQCVKGNRVVCRDRMRNKLLDEDGVTEKFGVKPASIPDWLALVGDNADGFPGVPRWGAKSAAAVLARYGHLDEIPDDEARWDVKVRGAAALAASLREHRDDARLYRTLATLRLDVPLAESLDDLRWRGAPRAALTAFCDEIGMKKDFLEQIPRWQE